jgi:hypothetical protein
MTKENCQEGSIPQSLDEKGAIPLILLGIGVAILMIVSFFIIFSTSGITQPSKPILTPKPEPTIVPMQPLSGDTQFIRVDLTVDLEKTRTIYCNSQFAESVQQESDQYKLELEKSAECINNFEEFSSARKINLKSCSDSCNTSHKKDAKKCQDDYDNQLIGDYDLPICVDEEMKTYNSCQDLCNTENRIILSAEYNNICQKPAVDESFRLEELSRKYCQDTPN